MDAITPIAMIEAHSVSRRARLGASAGDPVRPDAPERKPRLRRVAAIVKRGGTRAPRPAPARAH
jgi:hypothetical protein